VFTGSILPSWRGRPPRQRLALAFVVAGVMSACSEPRATLPEPTGAGGARPTGGEPATPDAGSATSADAAGAPPTPPTDLRVPPTDGGVPPSTSPPPAGSADAAFEGGGPPDAPAGGCPASGCPPLLAVALGGGGGTNCAVLPDRSVRCWGDNSYGQCGLQLSLAFSTRARPIQLLDPQSISVGHTYACAMVADGASTSVRCWGSNLGDNAGRSFDPMVVAGLSGATSLSAGASHTCAVAQGSALCWGRNYTGELGLPNAVNAYDPTAVPGLGRVRAIAAGTRHSCAILVQGGVMCWGANATNPLGGDVGGADHLEIPVAIAGLTGATAISAGVAHTCALAAGGSVLCWGSNGNGQLGDGTRTDSLTAVKLAVGLKAVALSAGGNHTCAIDSDKALWCWGFNGAGQLGTGGTSASFVPVLVPGLGDVTAVVAGDNHTCALLAPMPGESGGRVWCWGLNREGELGNGDEFQRDSLKPVQVLAGPP
jgi:alpha-tubulin suppressor-like RCC1 family protein